MTLDQTSVRQMLVPFIMPFIFSDNMVFQQLELILILILISVCLYIA